MKRGQYIRTLVFFLVILLLPTIVYSDFYVTLYVDGILGVLFSYMLYSYFSERKITAVFLLRFCAAAFVIALIKSSGVAFAAIALIIIVADVFFFHPKDTKSNTRQSLFSTLCLLLPVLALFVSRGSWKFYLQQVNSAEWNTSGVTLSGLMNLFTQNIPNYQIEGINEFVRRFTTVHPFVNNTANTAVELTYPINISYVLFIGALFVVAAIIAQLNKKTRPQKAFVFTAVMLTVCFLGYAVSLLILYLFTFQQWETVSCAAMDRYLGSYVLGVILFMTSMLLQSIPVNSPVSRLKIKSSSILAAILLFVLCFSNVNSIAKITVSSHFDILRIQRMRSDYSAAEQVAVRYENVTGNVLILSQETSYYYYNLCRYSLSPLRCTYGVPYALVDISDPQEIAAKQSSLASALTKCKYVFLMKTDDAFKRHYGKFFASPEDISDNSFYAVNQDERGIYLTKLVTG